jgi:twitching motility protein PilT
MPAVDSLLRLMQSQNADALSLSAQGNVKLSRAGAGQPLSMPPMGQDMVETFAGEVLDAAQMETARRDGSVHADYGEVVVHAKFGEGGWSLAFKKRPGAKKSVAPAAVVVEAPVAMAEPGALDEWLRRALMENASDLVVGSHVQLRVDGRLIDLGASVDETSLRAALALTPEKEETLAREGSVDLALVRFGGRFRVNVFRHAGGLSAAIRPVRSTVPTLASLDLPASLRRLAEYENGLVLVVGPTGSGKSTTLVALIEELNRSVARHVITLEDPIEYAYRSQASLIHQREVGTHVESFESGLRAALRESPDVILLGEMRDRPTIAAALTAAETGHLVLSSLHAGDSSMAIERIVDAFPEHTQKQVRGQLAGSLRAVLVQRLLPRTGGGRVPVHELMVVTPAVATMIREGKTHQLESAIQTGRDDGMVTMEKSISERAGRGEIARR